MSKLYSIQESTLTDIGDALRSKYGETYIEIERTPATIIKSSKATGFNTYGGYTGFNIAQVFKCPGASYIKLVYTTNVNTDSYFIKYAIGEFTTNTFPTDGIVLENATEPNTITIEADVITIRANDFSWQNRGYYIQATGYDANDNPIELEGSTIIEKEIEVKNTYSSADVAAAIEGLLSSIEPIELTGKQEKACGGGLASVYIEKFGNTISTRDLTDADNMFEGFTGERIPFDINFKAVQNNTIYASYLFYNCANLKELPKINNLYIYNSTMGLFNSCKSLREIPEDYFDGFTYSSSTSSYIRFSGMFYNCYSLRSLPLAWLKNLPSSSSNTSTFYYEGFYYCYALDELVNIPIPYVGVAFTSNAFNSTFNNCHRLKNITFEANEDGTPIVVQWKSQTIDLSGYIGYASTGGENYILNYNSGITADKKVGGDISYQALKDDPDWYTTNIAYSRYNHDSAVATINSLPDASAYLTANGGTNTIKFKGASGSVTDGGAINTLTEEEIAVAAAKGWTVTLV